jgi:hydrogenase maturation protease
VIVVPHEGPARARAGHIKPNRTLVIGLGNALLTDDAVGPLIAARLLEVLQERGIDDIEVDEDQRGGLQLMERLVGYRRAIIIDSIRTGQAEPGTLHRLDLGGLPSQNSASAHDANLATALDLGRRCGADLPADDDIILLGVEATDVFTFNEQCTEPVAAAIPSAVDEVLRILDSWRTDS